MKVRGLSLKTILIFVFCFIVVTAANAGSLFDRAGQDLWFAWFDDNGKRIGYNHETYEKLIYNDKVTLKTTSIIQHRVDNVVNDFTIVLYSTELEPLVKLSIKAVEKGKDGKLFTTVVDARSKGTNYIFDVNRNGEKKVVKIPRTGFDYFGFEDHFLYSRNLPGKSRTYKVLNSFTLAIEDITITYEKDETIKVEGKSYLCRKFIEKNKQTTSSMWRGKSTHAIVKQIFGKGTYIIRTTSEKAKNY